MLRNGARGCGVERVKRVKVSGLQGTGFPEKMLGACGGSGFRAVRMLPTRSTRWPKPLAPS